MTVYDHTRSPLTHKKKPWWRLMNPLPWVWTGWQWFAYAWAPADGCQYCWGLRLFFVGVIVGAEVMHWVLR